MIRNTSSWSRDLTSNEILGSSESSVPSPPPGRSIAPMECAELAPALTTSPTTTITAAQALRRSKQHLQSHLSQSRCLYLQDAKYFWSFGFSIGHSRLWAGRSCPDTLIIVSFAPKNTLTTCPPCPSPCKSTQARHKKHKNRKIAKLTCPDTFRPSAREPCTVDTPADAVPLCPASLEIFREPKKFRAEIFLHARKTHSRRSLKSEKSRQKRRSTGMAWSKPNSESALLLAEDLWCALARLARLAPPAAPKSLYFQTRLLYRWFFKLKCLFVRSASGSRGIGRIIGE